MSCDEEAPDVMPAAVLLVNVPIGTWVTNIRTANGVRPVEKNVRLVVSGRSTDRSYAYLDSGTGIKLTCWWGAGHVCEIVTAPILDQKTQRVGLDNVPIGTRVTNIRPYSAGQIDGGVVDSRTEKWTFVRSGDTRLCAFLRNKNITCLLEEAVTSPSFDDIPEMAGQPLAQDVQQDGWRSQFVDKIVAADREIQQARGGATAKTTDSKINLNRDPYATAEKDGLVCIPADAWTLQLDLDDISQDDAVMWFERLAEMTKQYNAVGKKLWEEPRSYIVTASKSEGNHRHVYIRLTEPLSVPDRIAIQMFLKSDPKREIYSLMRHRLYPRLDPLVLFETPEWATRVQAWMVGSPAAKQQEAAARLVRRIVVPT